MKPFIVDKTNFHFKLARLGGVKIVKDRVTVLDPITKEYTDAIQYKLNIKDFCSYWRKVALGSIIALCVLILLTVYFAPILIFLSCLTIPHIFPNFATQLLETLRSSLFFIVGGVLLGFSLASITIILITSKIVDWTTKRDILHIQGKLKQKPLKERKPKQESFLSKAYRSHKEKYCVPVKLEVDGSFNE
jgi:hypothetical protein